MIYFFIIAISYITVFLLTPNIRYVALKFCAIDKKNHRKIHNKIITKLGGLGIYLGFVGGLLLLAILEYPLFKSHFLLISGLMTGSTLMMLLGIYDDFQTSSPLTKLFIQTVVVLLLIKTGFVLQRVMIPGVIDIQLNSLGPAVTALWLLGVINAINLLDGLDGLASGVVAIVALFLGLYGLCLGNQFIPCVAFSLMGANLAFLKYNFHPAKIFMGDTGSLFLGCVIGCLAVYRPLPNSLESPLFIPCAFLLLLPIADTFCAIIRRIIRRQHIFSGDNSHFHHHYIKLGFSQVQTCARFYTMTFFLGVAAFSLIYLYFQMIKPSYTNLAVLP